MLLVAACSPSDDEADEADETPEAAAVTTTECSGEPLRFTTIMTVTGPLALPTMAEEMAEGTRAAVEAVNRDCVLGRPLEIIICDDKSDPNEATRCGREAASDGSLALFGQSGNFDTGSAAAGLPGVFTLGSNLFDLTGPESFAATSGLTLVVGSVSAAAAAGATDMLLVAVDSGETRRFVEQATEIAANLGVSMDSLVFPATTTDFAPVAAQVVERDPEAIGLLITNPVAFLNALADEGITAENRYIVTGVNRFPRDVIDQLGDVSEGVYLLSQATPPSDTDNPGIQQLLEELEAAGYEDAAENASPSVTSTWSGIHSLVDILAELPPDEIATLDSERLVEVLSQTGPVERPEFVPFDFTTPAYPEIPLLASLRLWSREALVLRVEDGVYRTISPFGDATQPFDLEN